MKLSLILIFIFINLGHSKVFLNTTDASDQSDQEIYKDNIELPNKINALIEEEKLKENKLAEESLQQENNETYPSRVSVDSIYPQVPTLNKNQNIHEKSTPKDSLTEARFTLVLGSSKELIEYNLGVLKSIEEYGFPLVSLGGSGWGAVISVLYSAGYDIADIKTILKDPKFLSPQDPVDYALIGQHSQYSLQLEEDLPRLDQLQAGAPISNIDEYQLSVLLSKIEKEIDEGYDSLRVPVFITVSSFKSKTTVILKDKQFIKNTLLSLSNSQDDTIGLKQDYFDGEYYHDDIEGVVAKEFNSKVLLTKLSNDKSGAITLFKKLKESQNSSDINTYLHLKFHTSSSETPALEKGYIDFSNRLSSLYRIGPKHKMDWSQKPKIYQDNIIFKGLDLGSIPSQYHSHIQSFFPLLKDDQSSFQEIQESLERLIHTNIYQNLKTRYIYDNYLRAYRLEIKADVISPIKYGLGFQGSSQLGAGFGAYYSQKWVSQMLFDWKSSFTYTEANQNINSQLMMNLGPQSEWEFKAKLDRNHWDLQDTWHNASNMDLWGLRKTKANFGFQKIESSGLTWGGQFKFVNTSFRTESTVNSYRDNSNPFINSPWVDFEGLFIDLDLKLKDFMFKINSGTQSQTGFSEAKNPLLIQPNLTYKTKLSRSNWEFKPKVQMATSATYESILDETFLFRPNFASLGGKLIDPSIDTLMRQKVEIGQLSGMLWDSRYYAHKFISAELPLKYNFNQVFSNWSWNTNFMATLLFDQPTTSSTREWYGIENYVQYESKDNDVIFGQELSFYKKWRDKSSQSPKWFLRIGLRRF